MPITTLMTVRGVPIRFDGKVITFRAGLTVDADGSPRAYGPNNTGLDLTADAGRPGRWWGILTENGQPSGNPFIQPPGSVCPGMYLSTTSYQRERYLPSDARRYVNAEEVAYVVLPQPLRDLVADVVLGCRAVVRRYVEGVSLDIEAVVADFGPSTHLGEGSMALATLLGCNADPRDGGTDEAIYDYLIYPGVPAVVNGETFELQPE